MKKLLWLFVLLCMILVIYHDVTYGTLPTYEEAETTTMEKASVQSHSQPYKVVKTRAGDTVISIMEREMKGPLPVSIQKLIADFEKLNPGVKADSLQIGKSYKFPNYNES